MGHVYANLTELKAFLTGSNFGADRDPTLLTLLESASRTVDGFCNRSRFGSGFGPRLGINTYEIRPHRGRFLLFDDLLIASEVKRGTAVFEDYTRRPGTPTRGLIGSFSGTVTIEGTWGYSDLTVPAAILDEPSDLAADATTVNVDDGAPFAIAQTISVEGAGDDPDEQMLVTGIATNALTVIRGVNGTTAAAHNDGAQVSIYRYPQEVVDATLRVAQRRWKSRDAGLTPDFGGGQMPLTAHGDTERSILYATVGHLRMELVG